MLSYARFSILLKPKNQPNIQLFEQFQINFYYIISNIIQYSENIIVSYTSIYKLIN